MDGISLSWRILSQAVIEHHALRWRETRRTADAEPEFRFLYRERNPVLPVWYGSELRLFNWGNPYRNSPLPRCRTISHERLSEGELSALEPETVEIPACFGWDRGIWYPIRQGVQGILVREADGTPVVYVVTRQATHYYEVMTRNDREPLFIGETI